jgi:micrococcal nuclease
MWRDTPRNTATLTTAMAVVPGESGSTMRIEACAAVLGLLVLWSPITAAETLSGRVVRIADGDTLTLLVGKEQVKVRLNGIDAPEKGQPFGTKAKQALSDLTFGKSVRVETKGKDKYGRTLGRVFVDIDGETVDVNARLVAQGLAWHYLKYSKDKALARTEEAARRERRGLWADA